MKKLLNILYITQENSSLFKQGETVVVKVNNVEKHQFPIHILEGIVCFGYVFCSPLLMYFCAEKKVPISFLSPHGHFWARVQGPVSGNVLLRRGQYHAADDSVRSERIARSILLGKIANSRTVLMRGIRDGTVLESSREHLRNVATRLSKSGSEIEMATGMNSLRGIEGEAAKSYFSVFDHLILMQKERFFFKERSRRPPLDNMNALLSFIYTLLTHDVISALEGVGLDPAVGFLHTTRPGRPSLALDCMEEFRSCIADRLALTLVNRLQIDAKAFEKSATGDVKMSEEGRKTVLVAYQKRKQEEILHPFIDEKVSIGLLPHIQAQLLSRHLRGDLGGYPPFIWK